MANIDKCQFCGKTAKEKSRFEMAGKTFLRLECGHTVIRTIIKKTGYAAMVSRDKRTPYQFQADTADFAETADINYICGHEMGLGKTVIECLLIARHFDELKPILIACKAGLRIQYWTEVYRWTGHMAQIIESSSEKPDFDMFDIFIISFDSLRLVRPVKSKLDAEMEELVEESDDANVRLMKGLGMKRGARTHKWDDNLCSRFNHIVIDETQQIKNPSSARTRSLMDIHKAAKMRKVVDNGVEKWIPKTHPPRVAGYSGTPIRNRPSELWTLLHMVQPTLFPFYEAYCRNHIRYSRETGKEVGLRDPEAFHKMIAPFFIRYQRAEVMPDLPKINRMFQLADMEGNFIEVYKRAVKEFQAFMDVQEKSPNAIDLLGWFSRMRHITGMAKVNIACEFTEQFLLENDRKLVIFGHHKEPRKALMEKLTVLMQEGGFEPPLLLDAGQDMKTRHETLERFKEPQYRILVASQQAAGEGLNMQFCSDCLMMERQWDPATEEQCEARFPRPGSLADIVNVWYLIAAGTIDDFLTKLVEEKRSVKSQVLDGENLPWETASLWADLAEAIQAKGLQKFLTEAERREEAKKKRGR